MALFDSIISEVEERFGLSTEKAGALLAALFGLITDPKSGGFGGFIDRFSSVGLGDTARSWITTSDNTPISNEQLESALGERTIASVADQTGIDRETATTALAGMIPTVVDDLTPDGDIPDESSLLSKIGGFLSDRGGTVSGAAARAAGAFTGNVVDRVDAAAEASYVKGKEALADGIGTAGAVADRVSGGMSSTVGSSGNNVMTWLLPLLILALLVILGFWFCGRSTTPTAPTNTNGNTNRVVSNVNTAAVNSNMSGSANAEAGKNLSELVLPTGTKLQAYPGGIEDQLVKFIQSDEYHNATNDQLKDKWFDFDDLNFVFGKTDLTPESQRQLNNIASILRAFPEVKIKIGAYTDKKGDDAANLKLSDSRAKAVQAELQKAGVGSQVPEAEGYGEKFATVDENASDEERKSDRKTAIRLIK